MTIAQLEAFLAVVRHGTVRAAADHEHASQPALTARIQSLEQELGAELFHRLPRGMTLTAVGRAFLPYAERGIAAIDAGAAIVPEVKEGAAGELVIGAGASVGTYVLPEVLARFIERRPNVRLSIRTGHPEEIVQMVAVGEVQVGITRESHDPRVHSRHLYDEQLLLVARPELVADAGDDQLRIKRFVIFEIAPDHGDVAGAVLRALDVPLRAVMELDNIAAAKRTVERGLGAALLPATAVADSLAEGRLVSIDLPGVLPATRPIVLLSRQDGEPDIPVVAALVELLMHVPDLVPGALRPSSH